MIKLLLLVSFLSLLVFQSGRITAAPADSSLNGSWHFVLDTPGGDREMEATFQVSGGNVTGKFGKDDVAGTFADNKLNLSFPVVSEESGEKGTLKLTGKMENEQLKGDWSFSDYSGTFKATRGK
jgi:hypothetical protein